VTDRASDFLLDSSASKELRCQVAFNSTLKPENPVLTGYVSLELHCLRYQAFLLAGFCGGNQVGIEGYDSRQTMRLMTKKSTNGKRPLRR
jgi:hypothetical protein